MMEQTKRRKIPDNVSKSESRISLIGGAVLATGAVALLARGATRYCPVKAKISGTQTLKASMIEQWRRTLAPLRSASAIDSFDALYIAELQELHDADQQLLHLLPKLARATKRSELMARIQAWADDVDAERHRLAQFLETSGAAQNVHEDDAMAALDVEAEKMLTISASPTVRDAALVASLQRIVHYRIATFGTLAAYAHVLGRPDEAASLSHDGDREKQLDSELTALAEGLINPAAAGTPDELLGEIPVLP